MRTFLAATTMALAMGASELAATQPPMTNNFPEIYGKKFWKSSGKTNRTAGSRHICIKKLKNRRRMAAQSRKANR